MSDDVLLHVTTLYAGVLDVESPANFAELVTASLRESKTRYPGAGEWRQRLRTASARSTVRLSA